MIKPIQLLKDSFATYKANFKNIIFMAWPIALLSVIAGYYSIQMDGMGDYKPMIWSVFIIGSVVNIIVSLIISLFFQPALFRSIQKNEDNKNFNIKDGYDFQKKNIWNYIVLFFWTFVYTIKINWKYLLVIILSSILASMSFSMMLINVVFATIIASLLFIIAIVSAILMVIRNTAKFIYPTNIFFSEDLKPRDSVKKAIEIGTKNNREIWKNILSYLLLTLIFMIIYVIVGVLSTLLPGDFVVDMTAIVLSSLVVAFLATPISFMVFAKGFNVLKIERVASN